MLDIHKKQVYQALAQIDGKESHLQLEVHWGPTKTEQIPKKVRCKIDKKKFLLLRIKEPTPHMTVSFIQYGPF